MKKSTIFMISFFVFALAGGIIYISYSASNFEEALKEGKYVNPIKGELRERKPINLIMNVWPGYGYPVIGIEKGFFEDQGVSVNIDVVQEYSEYANSSLISNNCFGSSNVQLCFSSGFW